jgi:hypothetical protein
MPIFHAVSSPVPGWLQLGSVTRLSVTDDNALVVESAVRNDRHKKKPTKIMGAVSI